MATAMLPASSNEEQVNGSENYIYIPSRSLGTGATSSVYEGRNKKSGEKVAVKVLKKASSRSSYNAYYEKEMKILTQLNHENIIRCIQVEEGSKNQEKLVILEWCRGGSLYNLIEQPEHKYGLPEVEVMTVLKHLASAQRYLFMQGIVHRDIKPGNILVYIDEALRNIYKIADFGTAHKLEDGPPESIEGTVEYLHPHAFHQAIHKTSLKPCGYYLDLWGIGCTMVHIMTGKLPFITLSGRRDRPRLQRMVAEKPVKSIGGKENPGESRPFTYFNELPTSCQLSWACKRDTVPLIAELLNQDHETSISPVDFCDRAIAITRKVPVIIFHLAQCRNITIYCDPDSMISENLHLIEEQSKISHNDILLYFKGESLNLSRVYKRGQKRPKLERTSTEEPVILLSKQDKDINGSSDWLEMAPRQEDKVNAALPQMPAAEGVMADYSLAKEVAGYVCLLASCIEQVVNVQFTFVSAAEALRKQTKEMLSKLHETIMTHNFSFQQMELRTGLWIYNIEDQLSQIVAVGKLLMSVEITTLKDKKTGDVIFDTVKTAKSKALPALDKLLARQKKLIKSEHDVKRKFDALEKERIETINPGCKREDRCLEKTDDIKRQIEEIFRDFKKDKNAKSLGYNDAQIHRYQRNLLKEHLKKCEKQFRQCLENFQILFLRVKHYIIKIQKLQGHAEILEEELIRVAAFMKDFALRQNQREEVAMFWMNKMRTMISLPPCKPGLIDSEITDSGYISGKIDKHRALPPKLYAPSGLSTPANSICDLTDTGSLSSASSHQSSEEDTGIETGDESDKGSGAKKTQKKKAHVSCINGLELALLRSKLDMALSPVNQLGNFHKTELQQLSRILDEINIASSQSSLSGSDNNSLTTMTEQLLQSQLQDSACVTGESQEGASLLPRVR